MELLFKFLEKDLLEKRILENDFPFTKKLFWDIELETINIQQHKSFIIERVIERGSAEDFYLLLKLYEDAQIIDTIKKSKVLDKKTINFCSFYFKIPLKDLHASSYYS